MKSKRFQSLLLLSFSLYIFCQCSIPGSQDKEVLPAHSHNDYEHERPLFDALSCQFKSIEADIYLVGDSLFVSHDFEDIQTGRTLRGLYLNPLQKIIQKNGGAVYGNGEELILLVDIKNKGLATYKRLHEILAGYQDILTSYHPNGKKEGALSVIVSGDRPLEYMKSQPVRLAAYDGRISDLDHGLDPELMPLVSDNWQRHFTWNGKGEMPTEERKKLREMVANAHDKGYILRFWATNDQPGAERDAVWNVLKNEKLDLIGTDDLKGLKNKFLSGFNQE